MRPLTDTWHVVPIDDLRDHEPDKACWCRPTLNEEEDGDVYIHHSLDGRELYETGERKLQ